MFGIMHIFEIALRNKIDAHYKAHFQQNDWLLQQSRQGGAFHGLRSASIIESHYQKLLARNQYTHDRLISELSFGFWTTLSIALNFVQVDKRFIRFSLIVRMEQSRK